MSTPEAVRLYSVASVAERLEVSTDYVYGRIAAGDLAVTELGHGRAKQRIRADVLQAFIDGRTFGLPPSTSAGEQSATSSSVVAPGRSTAGVPSTQGTNGRLPASHRPGHPPGT